MLPQPLKISIEKAAAALAEAPVQDTPIRPEFRARILKFLYLVRSAMFPKVFGGEEGVNCAGHLRQAANELGDLLSETMADEEQQCAVLCRFFEELPTVREMLDTDVRAAYEGDPAARSEEEIMLAYPAFEAISIYRLAHVLYTLGVPLIPRMMTEHAHKNTGIDIHPGATIGRYFFIDHGTGVVVGETCHIGEHVKLYQGVTLGAKSFELDENGNPVKGIKRHPDIGNHVVIYAGATILGGRTMIGDHCVIGGNVWLTHSVEAGQTVIYQGGQ
ncbi:MAG: serine acetyltransferase [Clostridia bacterium]|nr:serine acetyltransferase [Clostridia bacterium]